MGSNQNEERASRDNTTKKETPQTPADSSMSSASIEISESLLKTSSSSSIEYSISNTQASKSGSDECSSDSHRKPARPPISYATLITEAIQHSESKQLILSEIYDYIKENYPYFRTAGNGWKNSIRHNLSLNKSFCKVPRPQRTGKKGSYWRLADAISGKRKCDPDGIFRRHSLPTLFNRPTLPIYPIPVERHKQRTLSEGSLKFPPLRPRPVIDPMATYAFPTVSLPEISASSQVGGATSFGTTDYVYIESSGAQYPKVNSDTLLPDLELFKDNSTQWLFETNDSFGSDQIWPTGQIIHNSPSAKNVYFHDVWLGARSPGRSEINPDSPALLGARPDPHNRGI